jgi:cyclophilin family peptidyl-prolyl cis-trans isomerase
MGKSSISKAPPSLFNLGFAALLLLMGQARGFCGAPEIDPPIPLAGEPVRVPPKVPVGKTLLFPITANDPDGDPLTFTVTSSNPRIIARVKSGNPVLQMAVSHAAGAEDDPAYEGVLEFMLFRDWLPQTTGYMAGLAQSGFFNDVIFHRLADLGGGEGSAGYIFQGGDPIGSGGGGPGMTANDPLTAWKFQNEFHPGTIFTGRGQLAMANAGTNTGYSLGANGTLIVPDYLDTNGSQFFITDGQPRHLDFKHNIFGQLVRGWELLPKLRATKTSSSRPVAVLKITSASVVANERDAVLVLSARGIGTSEITVVATDPGGARATRRFIVEAVPDEANSNPFFRRMEPMTTAKDTPSVFALEAVDLEFDYLDMQHSLLPLNASTGPRGTLLTQAGRVVQMQPNQGYAGLISMGFSLRQYSVSAGGFNQVSDNTNALIAAGDRAGHGEPVTVVGEPASALDNVVVAKLHDLDLSGAPANFAVRINWGDGLPITTGTALRDSSQPGRNVYAATGTHTYAQPGVYPVVVEFLGNHGARTRVRSTAVISNAPLRAFGKEFEIESPRIVQQIVAEFMDSSAGAPGDYSARIDWGDGSASQGTISIDRASGKFLVRGTHGYKDADEYAVAVKVERKAGEERAPAHAWSRIRTRYARARPHLPPFPHGKLTIAWNNGPSKSQTGSPGANYQVTYNGQFVIINTGNRKLGRSKLRFWLSEDRVLNTTGPNRDKIVKVNGQSLLNIISFPAGAGGSGTFALKMPKGESTGGKFLLSEAVYNDPVADHNGTEKVIVTGPLPPTILVSKRNGLQTTEGGGTATFTVVLDTPPTAPEQTIASIVSNGAVTTIHTEAAHGFSTNAEVLISGVTGNRPAINGVHVVTAVDADTFTIPVETTRAGKRGKVRLNPKVTIPLESSLTTEGTVAPGQLVFTSADWRVPQTVTVTGVNDDAVDGNKVYLIRLKAAVSTDPLYNGVAGGEVQVTNLDDDTAPTP